VSSASWRWRLHGADESWAAGETFTSRAAAEEWLAARWESLAAAGTEAVSLYEEDAEIYRMGLGPEGP
jgi:hypothetical protein